MSEAPVILVVDDEPLGVELLARTLSELGRVLSAGSGERGWEVFRAEPRIDLVIADQRMPGMTGVELLTRVADTDPCVGRILLTGYADHAATVEAINRGRVHAYLGKPCQSEQLLLSVRSVLERTSLLRENRALMARLRERDPQSQPTPRELPPPRQGGGGADPLAGVGRLAGAIVEDLSAPLGAFESAADELVAKAAELGPEAIGELGEGLAREAARVEALCQELLDVARFADGEPELAENALDGLVEAALASLAAEAEPGAHRIETALDAGVRLRLDAERVHGALVHLLRNAVEAMPEGGELRVATRVEGSWAVVTVDDAGPGVPEAIRETLFEPFVSHGRSGRRGLGLALVQKVIEDHAGRVTLDKSASGGARFELHLPV